MKRIYIFGKVPFDKISKNRLIESVVEWGKSHKKKLILNMNAFGVVTFFKNQKYADIINSSNIVYPDGWGPVVGSKLEKISLEERINVGDIIDTLLIAIENKKLSIFILGYEKSVIKNVALTINKKYPKINIVGYHDGFFNKNKAPQIVKSLKILKPNIVFVGMGIPNQEYFIYDYWKKLPNAIYMGVGGVFYYVTNIKSRAPKWMRENYLEWLYRLFQEPKRLFFRYTFDNLYFVSLFTKSLLTKLFQRRKN